MYMIKMFCVLCMVLSTFYCKLSAAKDVLICGVCKTTFSSLHSLAQHKKTPCRLKISCQCQSTPPPGNLHDLCVLLTIMCIWYCIICDEYSIFEVNISYNCALNSDLNVWAYCRSVLSLWCCQVCLMYWIFIFNVNDIY